jgi:hypothetical protein
MDGAEQLAAWFRSCGPAKSGGMGIAPLDWTDIAAWAALTAWPITPGDAETIRELSRVYVSALHAWDEQSVPAPWQDEDRAPPPVDDIRNAFRQAAKRG